MRVCVSIGARTIGEAVEMMGRARGADLLELRGDYLRSCEGVEDLSPYADRLIVTVRRRREGGAFRGSEGDRLELLRRLMRVGPRYVDIEAASPIAPTVVGEARSLGVGVIASSHNFRGTPGVRGLLRAWRRCAALGPDVVKVATMALKPADNLAVLSLLLRVDRPTVAFCMGPLGRASRLLSPLFGAPFTYASLEEGLETAPGQLSLREVREAWRALGLE